MVLHIFSERKFKLIKRKYMDLEKRFNRLAGFIEGGPCEDDEIGERGEPRSYVATQTGESQNYRDKQYTSDCREGMFCLDYAHMMILRMGCKYGDLSLHMTNCHATLEDLERIVMKYEDRVAAGEIQLPDTNGVLEKFAEIVDLDGGIQCLPYQIEAIREEVKKSKKKPEEALNSILGLEPEEIRMFLEMIEEDALIKSEVAALSSQSRRQNDAL